MARADGDVLEHIAANVRAIRERRGITQEALAESSDLDLSYLQRVERAAANPTARVLARLGAALEVNPGEFFRPAKRNPAKRGRPTRARTDA